MVLGIYGASGLGAETEGLAALLNESTPEPRWSEILFIDDDEEKQGTTLIGRKILTFEKAVEQYGIDGIEFVLAFGEPVIKEKVFEKVSDRGGKFVNLIEPKFENYHESTQIGKSCIIRSVLPPCAKLGNCVLLQTTAVTGHDLVVGDNVTISPLAFVGGCVTIGKNTYIASGALIRNDIKIGENAIVGMGAVVTKDVPDRAVVYGNPAKVMRYNESGKVF